MQVSVSSHRDGGVLTILVSGEVDLPAGPVLENAIDAAIATDGVTLVQVDLSAVGFVDSTGIALLLKGRRRADERGLSYRVTGVHGNVRQVLEMTGVWEHLSDDPHGGLP